MLITGTFPSSITLGTTAPFVLEGTCILIISIIVISLAFPLLYSVAELFMNNKNLKITGKGGISQFEVPPATNYPNFPPLPSETIELPVPQTPYPTSINKSSEESLLKNVENRIPLLMKMIKNPSVKSCKLSNDSTLVSYSSYRHKLIEETLQKQYSGDYAPGNVILNLIELNTIDSTSSVILSNKYESNFFDDIKTDDEVIDTCKIFSDYKLQSDEIDDNWDQLSHFIPQNSRKPSTTETQTETTNPSEISVLIKPSIIPSARSNIPTSCQRMISNRSRDENNAIKSPSQNPLNAHSSLIQRPREDKSDLNKPGKEERVNLLKDIILLRDQSPLTEQLYKRNDTRPDVISRTHLDAEDYLNRIANNKRYEISEYRKMIQEPGIRSSLKKSRKTEKNVGNKSFRDNDNGVFNKRNGHCGKLRRSFIDDIRHLSTSKPSIWNN